MCVCVCTCARAGRETTWVQGKLKYSQWLQNPHEPSSQPHPAFPLVPKGMALAICMVTKAVQFIPVLVGFLHQMGRRRFALSLLENNPIENINELIMHTIKKIYVLAIL